MSYKIANKRGEDLICNLTVKDFHNLILTKDYPMYDIKMYTLASPTYNLELRLEGESIDFYLFQNYRLKDFNGENYLESAHVMTARDNSLNLASVLAMPYVDLITTMYSRIEFLGSHYSDKIYNSERIPDSRPSSDIVYCEIGKKK